MGVRVVRCCLPANRSRAGHGPLRCAVAAMTETNISGAVVRPLRAIRPETGTRSRGPQGLANETLTSARASSSASKNSAGWKLNMPAIITLGKVAILVL